MPKAGSGTIAPMPSELKEIQNREDVALLVNTFYTRVRENRELGPVFNGIITDWPAHLELLTDFWESQLFLTKRSYSGDPIAVHREVDKTRDHTITMELFGTWLQLWIATIDDLFKGEKAWIAKNRARKMATMFYMKMYEARP